MTHTRMPWPGRPHTGTCRDTLCPACDCCEHCTATCPCPGQDGCDDIGCDCAEMEES